MTKLLEHRVKELLIREGLTVPDGRVVRDPADARDLAQEWGEVWLKAQVLAGDRAAVRGVVHTKTPEHAEAEARRILGSEVHGLRVDALLVERAEVGDWQGYVSVSLAENPPRQVLRYSRSGGTGFHVMDADVVVDIVEAAHPFELRKALARASVPSDEIVPTSRFLHRVVTLAQRWSAETLELNPVMYRDGEFVVLDAKADLDDYSRALMPDPTVLDDDGISAPSREQRARDYQSQDHRGSLRYVQLVKEASDHQEERLVAVHAVGGGESLVLFDALADADLIPSNYCDTSGSPSEDKVAVAGELVAGQSHVSGLLFSTCIANQDLSITARGLVRGWTRAGWQGPTVVRLAGNRSEEAAGVIRQWSDDAGVEVRVLGEDVHEWEAAAVLADMLSPLKKGN